MKYQNQRLARKVVLSASVLAMTLVSGLVQAAPVTQWSFVTDSNFTASTFEAGGSGTTLQPINGNELSWGATGGNFQTDTGNANTNRSALTVGTGATGNSRLGGGETSGLVNTTIGSLPNRALGQIGNGSSFTHWNNPISSEFNTLLGGTITDTLTLTPTAGAVYAALGTPVNAPTLTFQFKFKETDNAGSGGVCAGGAPVPVSGCQDLFGFNPTTLNSPFFYADTGADGVFGTADDFSRKYFASVFVLDASGDAFNLAQLNNGECSELGLVNGCFGFRTTEAAQTTAQFAFAVTTEPISIPEPGSMALLGLALLGLGATRRQKARDLV